MGKCTMSQIFVIGGGEPVGDGDFLVRFFDYDGTLLQESKVDSGGSVTPPDAPTHANLTFQEWTHDTTNVTADINIGATYATTDGKTWVGLKLTTATTLNTILYYNKSDGSTLSIDWGDGSAVETTTSSGNNYKLHRYPTAGNYILKMWISSGSGTYGFGSGSSTGSFVGGDTQTDRDALQWIYIGDSVTSIGDYAFYRCTSLTSITIPNKVISIGKYAFYDCKSLTNITIPNSVTSIGYNVFYNCYSLTSITIPSGVTSISTSVFYNCHSLTSITIPSSVTSISTSAFFSCGSLTSITIPSGVTSIGSNEFNSCTSLTSITIPSNVTSIGTYAFYWCCSLTSITIPSGVTSIGTYAFAYCPSLKTYIFERTAGVTTISSANAFAEINSSTKIYVPDALVDDYKIAANWSTYANYIYPLSEKGVTHND